VITQRLDIDLVLARDLDTGLVESVPVTELAPYREDDGDYASAPELSTIDDKDWDTARRRHKLIEPFLERSRPPASEIYAAAQAFGIEGSTMYRWIRLYRASGLLASLLPNRSTGGAGKSRLPKDAEELLKHAIDYYYLSKQQPTVSATANEVARLCREAGTQVPHPNTVRARIRQLTEKDRLTRRAHRKKAIDDFEPCPDQFDAGATPLSVVQIDHTLLDLILVDEEYREPIGRPWLTIAIDVYSRMVTGFVISLDAPGASNVGLCMTHAILPKETWLAARGVTNKWPIWGFPATLHADNAKEFRGDMLRRACEQYGIELNFRVLKRPRYGAYIERLMGTLSTKLRELPGATFSSPAERGEYNSDRNAAMTLVEFERYFAEYITGVYHQQLHSGIGTSPLQRWRDTVLGTKNTPPAGIPPKPVDENRLRLDFLPTVQRSIQDYGVEVDHIFYWSDVFRAHIGQRSRNGPCQFVFRRDPRDISAIYFFDPGIKEYATIPYKEPAHPAISLWELRAIVKRLKAEGRAAIDENAIFEAQERLRRQQRESQALTKRQRRETEKQKANERRERVSDKAPVQAVGDLTVLETIEPYEVFDV
jgi:putative transposase